MNPDELALDMESHAKAILLMCDELEKHGCRGENLKCPFFHTSCSKLTTLLSEFLDDLENRRNELDTYIDSRE